MPSRNRDDFSKPDIQVLGERAGYICSNPACRLPTIGPHSDPRKSLKTGKACHIKAASDGGPRFDSAQSQVERSSIANGIWLCSVCSDRVDKDVVKYTVDMLQEWKREHEDWLSNGGVVPKIPELELTTLSGMSIPDTAGTVQLDPDVREHFFVVRNVASSEIFMIDARVQFPEPIIGVKLFDCPVGVNVAFDRERTPMVFFGSPGASMTRGTPKPTHIYELQIDRLPPGHHIKLGIRSSLKPWTDRDFSFDSPLWAGFNDPPAIAFYVDGKFQFDYQGIRGLRPFFAPIGCDKETRAQRFLEVRADYGTWKPGHHEEFC
jgi:hypothetical protein